MLTSLLLAVALPDMQTPNIQDLIKQVDSKKLKATVEKLASFPTRHTLSPGLKDAAEWLAGEYRKIPRVQVEVWKYIIPRGRRVPEDREVVEVVAVLPGKTDRRLLVGGHFDSLNLQGEDVTKTRAPGANDDASGTALALELARVMAKHEWNQTLVFCGFSGEEQGLNGSRALALRAKAEGWKLEAMLNNDIVGSSQNKDGMKDHSQVRLFSEEFDLTPPTPERLPHNSRELARLAEWVARRDLKRFKVKLILRRDRFQRGGDHTPFMENGYNAVRFCEMVEDFTRQHNAEDLPEFVNFGYLANVTRANLVTLASLANAGPAPTRVRYNTRQGHDTTLTWESTPGTNYAVYWRDTQSSTWQGYKEVGPVNTATIPKVNKDHHFFAVGAVGGVPISAG
jgi:hypothetical protein